MRRRRNDAKRGEERKQETAFWLLRLRATVQCAFALREPAMRTRKTDGSTLNSETRHGSEIVGSMLNKMRLRHSSDGVENLLFLLFVLHKHQGFIMIQDIKPGSQSTSPSLIILGQSIVYAKLLQNKQDQTGETTDSPLHLMSA